MTYEEKQAYINRLLLKNEAEVLAATITEYKTQLDAIRSEILQMISKYGTPEGMIDIEELKRFDRLAILKAEVEKKIDIALKTAADNIDALIRKQYMDAYYGYTWATEQEAGVALQFGIIDKLTLDKVLANPFLDSAIKGMELVFKKQIGDIFSIGFLEGRGFRDIASVIDGAMGIGERRALMIIRTESSRVIEAAKVEQFKEMRDQGIVAKLKYVAVLDNRTRKQSADMDGQFSDEKGKFLFPNGEWYFQGQTGHPEWDINDRCTTIQVIEGFEPKLRRARIDAENEGLVQDPVNFPAWAKERGLTESYYGEVYNFE